MEHHPPPQHGYGGLPFGAPQGANPPPTHLPFSYHQQQQPPASPYFPYGFFNPWDPPPPFVPPPSDPELQKRVDKFVEYAVKNGPGFEQMIMEKQRGNPAYAFLFGAPGHSYYRYRLWTSVNDHVGAFNPATPVPFPAFYEQQQHHHHHLQQLQHWQPLLEQVQQESSSPTRFKGLSGPLPTDVAAELQMVLENLTGTKESIKGAKNWFVQRSPFAPALAGALRQRILSLDDVDRQLHVIYLANDILFDSLQRRSNPKELDNEALAFQPVLGHMLATIYHNPQNQEANQSRLQKILQFWDAKEVYNTDIIKALEREMIAGHPSTPHASTLLPERPSAFQLSISSETGQNGV